MDDDAKCFMYAKKIMLNAVHGNLVFDWP